MADQLKNVYDKNYIDALAQAVKESYQEFDSSLFSKDVFTENWKDLELKERMAHIRFCLHKHIHLSYSDACRVLIESGKDFGGYAGMFFPDFVEKYGLDHWQESLDTLEVLTKYSSSEFAIRPFIELDQEKAFKKLVSWSKHSNEHVRRLASEGCRPRLPWARALKELKKDPTPIIPILENLNKDESLYVRKSVANNLNDISKDHPELALKLAKKWIKSKNPHTIWIVKHGLRTLLKAGNSEALECFGYGKVRLIKNVDFQVITPIVELNDYLEIEGTFTLKKNSKVRLEYAICFLHKNGTWGRKVFKISESELEKGEYEVDRKHHFKKMTTRTFHEGVHGIEFIINGRVFSKKAFYFLKSKSPYYVYLLQTYRNTFYCGVTTDMNRRYREHIGLEKGGAKFTKAQKPTGILLLEFADDRSSAQKREAALKKLSRKKKEELISHDFYSLKS